MKNILIVNEVCSDNIGDHAINEGIRKALHELSRCSVSVGFDAEKKHVKPKSLQEKNKSGLISRIRHYILWKNQPVKYFRWYINNIRRIKKTLSGDYERIIIGGGQLVQSGGTFPIAMYLWVRIAKKNNIPVYIVGVGCAEKFSTLDIWLYKKAFAKSHAIFVREKKSIEKLEVFFAVKSNYIPDLAYALYEAKGSQDFAKKNHVIVGATAFYVHKKNITETGCVKEESFERYVQYWEEIIDREVQAGNLVILVSTTVEDAELNKYLYHRVDYINKDSCIELVEMVPELSVYLDYLKRAKRVYSGRMHSLILGHLNHCELAPALLSKKIEYYMQEYSVLDALVLQKKVNETIAMDILK
ncbi:polysaccharide pyruvyl transferase family protein [Serratia marcescens]|nr:polysaccharide pyruvyl transferase family protein [Serratia marcescens]